MLSCPSQISVSSHVLKKHKTSFAELARYKNIEKSPLVVKENEEDPTCSQLSQNILPVQWKASLGQNVILTTSNSEKESERSGSSETAGKPPSGKQTKGVILFRYIIF